MEGTSYLVALGANRRSRWGSPVQTLRAAAEQVGAVRLSRIRATPALGPAGRSFANAAMLVTSDLAPPALLARLKQIEKAFGRRPGRRWGPRSLDLDIILWSQGVWTGEPVIIPHCAFRTRKFVLEPLAELAPLWRDPISGLTVRQLLARLTRPRPVDPRAAAT